MAEVAKCRECGSAELNWDPFIVRAAGGESSQVADGRLRIHDLKAVFVLGCQSCSATIQIIPAEKIARSLDVLREVLRGS